VESPKKVKVISTKSNVRTVFDICAAKLGTVTEAISDFLVPWLVDVLTQYQLDNNLYIKLICPISCQSFRSFNKAEDKPS
jgi:hypothetical protein